MSFGRRNHLWEDVLPKRLPSPPPCSRHHAGGSPAKGTYITYPRKKETGQEGGWLRSPEFTVTQNVLMICFARIWKLKLSVKKLHV